MKKFSNQRIKMIRIEYRKGKNVREVANILKITKKTVCRYVKDIARPSGFQKGHVAWNKGIQMNEEIKRKISEGKKKSYREGKTIPARGMLGKHHSEEAKRKMSIGHKGKHHSPNTEFKKGYSIPEAWKKQWKKRTPWNKGKTGIYSEESIKRMSKAKLENPSQYWLGKKRPDMIGSKHFNWNGGSSFEPYGIEFNDQLKKQIRKRDGYRCQECFRHQNELNYTLHVHHIDYNKKNNNPNNLISLCRSCHMQTSFGRNEWIKYFQDRMFEGGRII